MKAAASQSLGLALDPAGLNALKGQAGGAPNAALKKVAQQFEAVFVNMMLKSMREATPSDGAMDSEQSKMFTGMLDEQYASHLTQGKGLGLADMIVRQFSRAGITPAADGAADADSAATAPAESVSAATPAAPAAAAAPASVPAAASRPDHSSMAPARFKSAMADHAAAASERSGIPADFMIAQAGLESGWGRHQPVTSDGQPSHNLFGIKAGPTWRGPVVQAETTEVVNGRAQRVVQPFRAYASYGEAFQDYANLLSGNARYARATGAAASGNASDFAGALQKAGYATDPAYAEKLRGALQATTSIRV